MKKTTTVYSKCLFCTSCCSAYFMLFYFCTGHFVMVPLNLTYLHCLQHFFLWTLNWYKCRTIFYFWVPIYLFKTKRSQWRWKCEERYRPIDLSVTVSLVGPSDLIADTWNQCSIMFPSSNVQETWHLSHEDTETIALVRATLVLTSRAF